MAKKGETLSDETKKKISESRKGKYHSEESKQKIRDAKTGKKLSEEHKRKISEGGRGKKKPHTPEHCANISKACKGRKSWTEGKHLSDEHKHNISVSVSGKNHTRYGKKFPEHSKRMSGKNNPMFGQKAAKSHGTWYINKWTGENIWLRSSWEVLVADYLYDNCIIYDYECKTFDLGDTTYTPDFYLISEDKFIEIKGYLHSYAKQKIEMFRKMFPSVNYEIWDKKILVENHILGDRLDECNGKNGN